MTEKISAVEKVCLDPKFLDKNFRNHVLSKLKTKMLGRCNQDYGYIIDIDDKFKIISNEITPTACNVFITGKFKLNTLKPKAGEKYTGLVSMIFADGVFVTVLDKLKILVPQNKLAGYKYSKKKETFEKNGIGLKLGQELTVCVDKVRYDQKEFNCIGSLP